MDFTTVGYIGKNKRQDSTKDMNLAISRLDNYQKGYVTMNLTKEKIILRRKGYKK